MKLPPPFYLLIIYILIPGLSVAESNSSADSSTTLQLTAEEQTWLDQHRVIRIAADPDYAPFQFTNDKGKSVGLANDYLEVISQRLGVRFQYILPDSWAQALQLVKDKQADMVAVATSTPERLEYMRFTKPYMDFPDVIITRSGENISSLDQLHGQHLLTIKGFGINEFLRKNHPQIELRMEPDIKTLLGKLSTGQANAGVLNLATTSYAIDQWKITNLHFSSLTDFSYKLAFATRHDWPILQSILQKGIDSIDNQDQQAITRNWVGLRNSSWAPTKQQLITTAVALVIIGFAFILIWNQQLRKTVESRTRELRASKDEYRNLYKTALVGLYRTTIDGSKVLAANPELASQFGYDNLDTFIKEFASRDAYVERKRRDVLLNNLREFGKIDNFEFLGIRRDGSIRNFLLSATLYEVQGYLEGAILDITDRKKAEDDARIASEIAEKANRVKSDFLAAASHDLRQPLHVMSLQIAQLDELLHDKHAKELLSQINTTQFSLRDILNSLLDISHLNSGSLKPNITHFPLTQLFTRLDNEFSTHATENNVKLRIHMTQAWLHTDPTLLYRILANLVDNAIKHSRSTDILIGARKRANYWRIEVWDCGPGIPEDQQHKIFDEFIQLNNPERNRHKGLGLGLYIVQQLNQLLNLQLNLISSKGHGTCFRLLVKDGIQINSQSLSTQKNEKTNYSLQGAVILIVDDNPEILNASQTLLTTWKCAVLTATSLQDALEVAENEEIDAIIADYHLSDGHTGTEVIDALKQNGCENSKAIIITGDANPQAQDQLRNINYPILSKPVLPMTLRSTLHRLIQEKNTIW